MNLHKKILLAEAPMAIALAIVCIVSVVVISIAGIALTDGPERQLSQRSCRSADEGGHRALGQRRPFHSRRRAAKGNRAGRKDIARSSRPS